jgi:hypothetical protein
VEGEEGSPLAGGESASAGLPRREVAEAMLDLLLVMGELLGLLAPLLSRAVLAEDGVASLDRSPATRERADAATRELLAKLPHPLRDPRARRCRACLRWLMANAGAGNEQVRVALSISSSGQVSTMLERLLEAGLLVKVPGRAGSANAWSLSAAGEKTLPVLQTLVDLGVA